MKLFLSVLAGFLFGFANFSSAQQISDTGAYKFTGIILLKATPVKDQGNSGTCWCFSAVSMLESELLRMGKGEYNLSEMFIVRHTFDDKALRYVRMQGNNSFSEGGEFNDVINTVKNYGIVPETVYTGLKPKEEKIDHSEMGKVTKGYVDAIAKTKNHVLSNVWFKGYDNILDSYLGTIPDKFSYADQNYEPMSFAKNLGINPDDYVLFTSFTHHPFYQKFILEIPDNWSWGEYHNVPLDELISIINNSLDQGYTVAWAADVSEKGFSFSKGLAIIPDFDEKNASASDWENALTHPTREKTITQEMRQEQFDNFATTDDHGMHITGYAKDTKGQIFYYVKNSWGTKNVYNGYLYASDAYVRLKTMSVMVNKNALQKEIRNKFSDLK